LSDWQPRAGAEIVAAAEYETQALRHGADEYAQGVMTGYGAAGR